MAGKRVVAPRGLGARGRALFAGVVGKFELDAYEAELLVQAAQCVDRMQVLAAQVERDGPVVRKTLQGPVAAHPLLAELRAQQNIYMHLLKALGLPHGEQGVTERVGRPPRQRATQFEMAKGQRRGLRAVDAGGGA